MKKFLLMMIFLVTTLPLRAEYVLSDEIYDPALPIKYYFNIAFDTAQNRYAFDQKDYFNNHSTIIMYMRSPSEQIEKLGGYWPFFRREWLGEHAVSNWGLHFMGGGYDFRHVAEWYQINNYPAPYVLAFITNYLGNLGNEAVEFNYKKIDSLDHIADLFFFDIAGKLLFLNDSVAHFFYDTAHVRKWDYTPMYDPHSGKIFNAGLNYMIRPALFENSKLNPFFYMGMQQMAGVSIAFGDAYNISPAVGTYLYEPFDKKMQMVYGFFLDKKDRPLVSLLFHGAENYDVHAQLFPHLFDFESYNMSIMLGFTNNHELSAGVSFNTPIGIGFGNNFYR